MSCHSSSCLCVCVLGGNLTHITFLLLAVGYGTISPSGEVTGCYAIRFTCAFVAFIGVIFASVSNLLLV